MSFLPHGPLDSDSSWSEWMLLLLCTLLTEVPFSKFSTLLNFIFLDGWSLAGCWGWFLWLEPHFMLCQIYIPKILWNNVENGKRGKHPSYLSCWNIRMYTLIFGPKCFGYNKYNHCFFFWVFLSVTITQKTSCSFYVISVISGYSWDFNFFVASLFPKLGFKVA